jgi:6-phosphogluconolactonase
MKRIARQYAVREEMSAEAARQVAAVAHRAVTARGRCTLVLAGGGTPRRTYELLAVPPLAGRMPWQQTHIFFSDERCVAPDHRDSNYRMALHALLAHVPIPSDQVHRMQGEGPADAAAQAYEDELRSVFAPEAVQFDLVLLGLGPDGHTASLFPGTLACDGIEKLVTAVAAPALEPRVPRITLTLPALNTAQEVLFLVAGKEKAEIIERVIAGDMSLPAARVRPRERLLFLRSKT